MSIGVCYDSSIRNNGTGILVFDALQRSLGFGDTVRRYEPHGLLPPQDLYLYVDDGRDDNKWECPKPNAYWAIDTHLGYDYRAWKAKQFDRVYCAQKDGAEKMRQDGLPAEWLPLACHPPCHPNQAELMQHPAREELCSRGLHKMYDVAFIGFLNKGWGENSNNRVEFLDHLFKEFTNFWITTNCFFEEMAVRYVRSRVGMNISILSDLNMRFFELLSIGVCQVTNRDQIGWQELGFEEGKHFLGFDGKSEMCEKVQWALDHPEEREQIAQAGHELARKKHTYAHRVQRILDDAGIKLPERVNGG
ncbi:MAG: glycosyltransferase [Gammaproteobacteria bacterium]|nr:glycosyltransferase [Gammaproteobacteria bacterium]